MALTILAAIFITGALSVNVQAGKGAEAKRLQRLWVALGSADRAVTDRAAAEMVTMGDRGVAFLATKLRPVSITPERIKSLIADLDSDKYAVRKKAHDELMEFRRAALPAR